MNSIDFETLVTVIFVLVDDWYQLEGKTLRDNLPGAKPIMSDSEILTLGLIMDYLPFPGETQFMGFIRANYGEWFPNLLDKTQKMKYFGYKLVMLSTLQGLPIAYELVPANTDEREAVEGVLQLVH